MEAERVCIEEEVGTLEWRKLPACEPLTRQVASSPHSSQNDTFAMSIKQFAVTPSCHMLKRLRKISVIEDQDVRQPVNCTPQIVECMGETALQLVVRSIMPTLGDTHRYSLDQRFRVADWNKNQHDISTVAICYRLSRVSQHKSTTTRGTR